MYCIAVILILSLLAFMIWASADVGSNVYVRASCSSKTDEKLIALTFDDGPDVEMTSRVLDILSKYDVKATFFLIGSKAERNPDIVRRMTVEGHTVANHTYSHLSIFPLSSYKNVVEELECCKDAIKGITGKRPLLFRPPFGVTNPIIGRAIKNLGMQCIGWSIRSFDTIETQDAKRVFERVRKRLHNGAIVLLHDRCRNADILLEMLIKEILKQGYRIVPIDELLKIKSYED